MKRIVVLGGGISGYGSAILAKKQGFDVFLSDAGRIAERFRSKLDEWCVPYEEGGWTAYVDGREVDITPVGNALVALNLSRGEHSIELVYYPKGFKPGAAASAVCLAVFAAICVYVYIIKKKKGAKTAAEATPAPAPEKAPEADTKKK